VAKAKVVAQLVSRVDRHPHEPVPGSIGTSSVDPRGPEWSQGCELVIVSLKAVAPDALPRRSETGIHGNPGFPVAQVINTTFDAGPQFRSVGTILGLQEVGSNNPRGIATFAQRGGMLKIPLNPICIGSELIELAR
jgi:hypothetical protein